jgi:hypothetical protein
MLKKIVVAAALLASTPALAGEFASKAEEAAYLDFAFRLAAYDACHADTGGPSYCTARGLTPEGATRHQAYINRGKALWLDVAHKMGLDKFCAEPLRRYGVVN